MAMPGLRNLLVRGGADFSAMHKAFRNTEKTFARFQKNMGTTTRLITASLATLSLGAFVTSAVKGAMEVESAMQQIDRTMGESADEFKNWAKETALSFNMGSSTALKYGGIYSNLLTTFTKDTAQTMSYSQDLLKSSAIVASSTGRSMEDVMWRIRSGLLGNTEAIEDLGVNIYVNLLESTQAFKRFAGDKSWNQLDFQTQQTIRYFGILEQVSTKFGDEVRDNTSSRLVKLSEVLKDVRVNIGFAFTPILYNVLPILTQFSQKLLEVTNTVAQFSKALFGTEKKEDQLVQVQADRVENLGDAYEEAGKKAKGSVAGFDEVNQLADNTAVDIPSIQQNTGTQKDVSPIGNSFKFVEEISKNVEEMANKVKQSFARIKPTIDELSKAVKDFFLLFKPNGNKEPSNYMAEFEKTIKNVARQMTGLVEIVTGLLLLFSALGYFMMSDPTKAWEQLKKAAPKLGEGMQNFLLPEDQEKKFDEADKKATDKLKEMGENLKKTWEEEVLPKLKGLTIFKLSSLLTFGSFSVLDFGAEILKKLQESGKTIIPAIKAFFVLLGITISGSWSDIVKSIGFNGIRDKIWTRFQETRDNTVKWFIEFKKTIIEKWQDLTNINWGSLKTKIIGVWNSIKTETANVFDSMIGGIKNSLNKVIEMVNSVIKAVNSINFTVPSWVPKYGGKNVGFNVSIPEITPFAQGGIVDANSPMLAMVGDNKTQKEAIAPIDDLMSMVSSAVLTAMQATSNRTGDIVLNIDGVAFARVTNAYNAKETTRIGANMIRVT
jgi:hypothetical protein